MIDEGVILKSETNQHLADFLAKLYTFQQTALFLNSETEKKRIAHCHNTFSSIRYACLDEIKHTGRRQVTLVP